MANMQVGQSGKKLFQEWEGLELNEYLDSLSLIHISEPTRPY